MADSNIKKVKISNSSLPPMSVNAEGYIVKYRIVSDDRNRVSQWSPIQIVKPEYTFVSGDIDFSKAGNIATVAWNAVNIEKDSNLIRTATEYDVWVRWDRNDGGDWIYRDRIANTSVSLLIPSTYSIGGVDQAQTPNRLNVEIFLKGNPITRDNTLLRVYTGGPYTV